MDVLQAGRWCMCLLCIRCVIRPAALSEKDRRGTGVRCARIDEGASQCASWTR